MAIESSPVAGPLLGLIESTAESTGTASELLAALDAKADDRTRRLHGWPKGARALAGIVKRLAPNLRRTGIEVDTTGYIGRGTAKRKAISLVRKEGESIDPTRPTCPSRGNIEPRGVDGGANGDGGDATGAQGSPLLRPKNQVLGSMGRVGAQKYPPIPIPLTH